MVNGVVVQSIKMEDKSQGGVKRWKYVKIKQIYGTRRCKARPPFSYLGGDQLQSSVLPSFLVSQQSAHFRVILGQRLRSGPLGHCAYRRKQARSRQQTKKRSLQKGRSHLGQVRQREVSRPKLTPTPKECSNNAHHSSVERHVRHYWIGENQKDNITHTSFELKKRPPRPSLIYKPRAIVNTCDDKEDQ